MHWIYLIHEFHNLSWITEINDFFKWRSNLLRCTCTWSLQNMRWEIIRKQETFSIALLNSNVLPFKTRRRTVRIIWTIYFKALYIVMPLQWYQWSHPYQLQFDQIMNFKKKSGSLCEHSSLWRYYMLVWFLETRALQTSVQYKRSL